MELMICILLMCKYIVLVVYDYCKQMLMNWVECYQLLLEKYVFYVIGIMGNLIQCVIGMDVNVMLSGLMGGDQQVGVFILEGKIDVLIFFWDLFNVVLYDFDVKVLLCLVIVWNIFVVINVLMVDFIIQFLYFNDVVDIFILDYVCYLVECLK